MKRISLALLISGMTIGMAWSRMLLLDPVDSGSIIITTVTTSPTRVFTNNPNALKSFIINTSSNNVFFVGYSTSAAGSINTAGTVSTDLTTGNYYLLGSSSATIMLDGPDNPFTGPLWAVATGNGGSVIQRVRFK